MTSDNSRPLLDSWVWEHPMLKAFVSVCILVPVFACAVLFAFIGSKALFVLLFACFGPFFGFVYGLVDKLLSLLADTFPPIEGTFMHGLIIRNLIESAGILVLGRDALILQPVAGKRFEIGKNELTLVREIRWFNGQFLIGKTGFWFQVPGLSRFACAIPNYRVVDFRLWLSQDVGGSS